MNLFLLLLAIAAVSATFFGWLALEYRRTPIDEPFPQVHARNAVRAPDGYLDRLAATPKDRIDQLLEDDKATRDRRPS